VLDQAWHFSTAAASRLLYSRHMTRTLTLAGLLILSLDHAHCQNIAFEVASITPSKPGTPAPPMEHAGMVQFVYPGGRFNATATTLQYLLEWAYGIQPSQHTGGPSWMDTDRYDIVAKAEGNPTDAQMEQMVQTLLVERFKLKFHRETKELSAYVMSAGKTAPKLFPPKEGEPHSLKVVPMTGAYRVIATRFSLAQLTDTFARQLGTIIVNHTGLDGDFDFTLDLAPDDTRPNPLDPTLLITAMREQLGLTLKSQKTPVDILVIESAEKVPAGN
jgi:uncharacterized protein (TIGR03435 family)